MHEMPLYKIPISGLSIGEPEQLFIVTEKVSKEGDTMTGTLKLKRMFGETAESGGLFPSAYTIGNDRTFAITRSIDDDTESMLFFNRNGLGLLDGIDEKFSYFSRIVKGSYVGNNEPSRFIDLGFTPMAVLVMRSDGVSNGLKEPDNMEKELCGGLATTTNKCSVWNQNAEYPVVEVVTNGFNVFQTDPNISTGYSKPKIKSNTSGSSFTYIAIR